MLTPSVLSILRSRKATWGFGLLSIVGWLVGWLAVPLPLKAGLDTGD